MNVLVVGCGSIGRRHIGNLLALGHIPIGIDPVDEYRQHVEDELKIKTYRRIEDAYVENPPAALVCTPPNSHIQIANELVSRGIHTFIEKPLSNSLDGIDGLIESAKENNVRVMVGYNWRFSRGLGRVREIIDSGMLGKMLYARIFFGQYLPDWRPWQDYRKSYSARKELGGGIILDDSHEVDYALWLFGGLELISCVGGKLSGLEINVEDTAELLLRSVNGAVVSIHLDFVRRDKRRDCEVVCENGTIKLDLITGKLEFYDASKGKWKYEEVGEDINQTYVKEIMHFMDCCERGTECTPTIQDAKRTLEVCLKAREMCGI